MPGKQSLPTLKHKSVVYTHPYFIKWIDYNIIIIFICLPCTSMFPIRVTFCPRSFSRSTSCIYLFIHQGSVQEQGHGDHMGNVLIKPMWAADWVMLVYPGHSCSKTQSLMKNRPVPYGSRTGSDSSCVYMDPNNLIVIGQEAQSE